eukprot:CAMPEP_0172685686 /NCGR_PEP_ID=MMETSP1074-20121228/20417_1 /TAXON_ID=2916 /ORGANISM="Ceratium fusus, Strain PA161109" /LENGTH=353 /DNA_ID=CAMNT_0013504873 /DNA_START=171 /DNA_END=1232 /DNA_ORIENTATION=-
MSDGVVGLLAYDICEPLSEEEYDKWLFNVHYHDLMSNPYLEKIILHTVSKDKKAKLSSGTEVQNSVTFFRLAELHFQSHEAYGKYIEYFQTNAIPPPRSPVGKSAFKFYLIAQTESMTKAPAEMPISVASSPSKVLVVGSSGNIGQVLVKKLRALEGVTVIEASRSGAVPLDIYDANSVKGLDAVAVLQGGVDHVIVSCGASTFGPISSFDSAKWMETGYNKFVALTRLMIMLANGTEVKVLRDGGSITVTTGQAARVVNKMWPGISANNAGLEAFIKSAAVEAPRGVRLNAVAPGLVRETAVKAGMALENTVEAEVVAAKYIPLIFGTMTGQIVDAGKQQAFKKSHHDGMHD